MRIAVFGNIYKKKVSLEPVQVLFEALKDKQAHIITDHRFFDFLREEVPDAAEMISEIIDDDSNDFSADIALSVGGDGTFLSTAMRVGNKQIPILGINAGRLGFLADVSCNEIEDAINEIYSNNYIIEQRSLIQLKTDNPDFCDYPHALNEIAILKQDSSSMIAIDVRINGEYMNTYQADGLLIATPTGSTAYSMSVGGPVVAPQANSLILSPVASHSLNVRPLIIPDTWTAELGVRSRSKNFLVSLDGRSTVFEHEYKIVITKSDFKIRVIKRPQHTFFNTLKNKLMWGADKRS
ncbi:NAD kinase [Bacteroidia bacterium]|nr:NAD kinase [Bacteroidia bacterium]